MPPDERIIRSHQEPPVRPDIALIADALRDVAELLRTRKVDPQLASVTPKALDRQADLKKAA